MFLKYSSYDELDLDWRIKKTEIADFLLGFIEADSKVLSIGCGLGFIEAYLWRHDRVDFEIHVQDFSETALKWIKTVLPGEYIHGKDWPVNTEFDLVFLGAVDYALADDDFISLLQSARQRLKPGGGIVVASASYYESQEIWPIIVSYAKWVCKRVLVGSDCTTEDSFGDGLEIGNNTSHC